MGQLVQFPGEKVVASLFSEVVANRPVELSTGSLLQAVASCVAVKRHIEVRLEHAREMERVVDGLATSELQQQLSAKGAKIVKELVGALGLITVTDRLLRGELLERGRKDLVWAES